MGEDAFCGCFCYFEKNNRERQLLCISVVSYCFVLLMYLFMYCFVCVCGRILNFIDLNLCGRIRISLT